jgi:1-deoxy-D-xylulose-5-phosphate synthase
MTIRIFRDQNCTKYYSKGHKAFSCEENQTVFHAPGKYNKETGERIIISTTNPTPPRYQMFYGETLVELAEKTAK